MKIKLKPVAGRRVRDPATGRPLPKAGAAVDPSPFWSRRLDDGDVVPVSKPKES